MAADYLFLDEWDVDAPQEAVFDALADTRTYPMWWRPTYVEVKADGPPTVGCAASHKFKATLPYTMSIVSTLVRLESPHTIEAMVDGDLRGRALWTLSAANGKVHVRFDWRVYADRLPLRIFAPVLRPLTRWNHNEVIKHAMDGLEPYARAQRQSEATPSIEDQHG